MPHSRIVSNLRLRLLLRRGEIPQWIGELLLALGQSANVELQLLRLDAKPSPAVVSPVSRLWHRRLPALSAWSPDQAAIQGLTQWENAAKGDCDITVILENGLQILPENHSGASLQWALVDGFGGALCSYFPLLTSICTGQGLHLILNQRKTPTTAWLPQRSLRLSANSDYGRSIAALPNAVLRLLQQAMTDWSLGNLSGAAVGQNLANSNDGIGVYGRSSNQHGLAWWTGFKGNARAWSDRQKARLLKEYWRIGVMDAPIHSLVDSKTRPPVRWLTKANSSGYWADPFGLADDPHRLFCEFFDERAGVGFLEVLQFDAKAQVAERTRLRVAAGKHASFPNVFELDGRRLGVAETLHARECVLHEVNAAGHWHALFPLLQNVAAADPTLFSWEGRLWLAYTDIDIGTMDNLCLQYADQLEGPWTPHANNPVKLDIASARMAGGFFHHNGSLYRPGQNCLQTYGGSVEIHRIVELTPHSFAEVRVRTLAPDAQGPCPDGLHTLNAWGDRTLVDGKHHGVNLVAIGRHLRQRLQHRSSTGAKATSRDLVDNIKKRHLLVYVPHLRTGGGEISMLRLASGLVALGLQVDLVVHSKSTCELEVPPGVTLIDLDCGGTAAAVWKLAKLLRKGRPDWLLSAFPHTNIASVAALTLSGVDSRCVVSEHAPLALQIKNQNNWRYRLLPPLVRWAYRRAHSVVAVSAGVRDDLQTLLGASAVPLVIGNPVLAASFEAEMQLLPDDPWLTDSSLQVVLSVGRLSVEKDLVTLIHAFAEVSRHRPAARLVLAGEGPDRPRLQMLIDELGLTAIARLPGRTATPLSWMRHAAVFVLASQYEGFGNVLVEAMACGTPVISTDCPVGPRDILAEGRFGKLVPVGDARAMALAIESTLDKPVPSAGARDAALRYTQANACATYLELLQSLYAGGVPC